MSAWQRAPLYQNLGSRSHFSFLISYFMMRRGGSGPMLFVYKGTSVKMKSKSKTGDSPDISSCYLCYVRVFCYSCSCCCWWWWCDHERRYFLWPTLAPLARISPACYAMLYYVMLCYVCILRRGTVLMCYLSCIPSFIYVSLGIMVRFHLLTLLSLLKYIEYICYFLIFVLI